MFLAAIMLVPSLCFGYGPYRADLVRVIDGDTLLLDVALWPGLVQRISVRLDGVNTPEKRSRLQCEKDAGMKATKFVEEMVAGGEITVHNIDLGKYAGRVLGDVYVDGNSIAVALIEEGLALPYDGGKRGPWCVE